MSKSIFKLLFLVSILFIACEEQKAPDKLPYIGQSQIVDGDTLHHRIPPFSFRNQDSIRVDNESLSETIYIADFFYTYCLSICPIVQNQMLRIYDKFEEEDNLKLVSFALDPKRDDVKRLKNYAHNLGVQDDKWLFLTGDKDETWELAEAFFVSVVEDENDVGEIFHSGKILLIDKQGHVRAFAEGTDEAHVTAFLKDIEVLLQE